MNRRPKLTAVILLAVVALACIAGTKVSQMTRTRTIDANARMYVVTQDVSGRFYSRYIQPPDLASNLGPWITNTVATALATNIPATNATSFGLFEKYSNGVFRYFGIEQGTNTVLYRNGSNVVVNATGTGSGGGNLTTNANQFLGVPLSIVAGAQITNANFYGMTIKSNILHDGAFGAIVSFINTSNYFGSWVQFGGMFPGTGKVITSQDALGNSIWKTPDVPTSVLLTASNAIAGNLLVTSNGAVAFTMTASNVLRTDITNLQGATNGLTTRATNLEGSTNGLRTDVLNLQGATNALNTRMANAQAATNLISAKQAGNAVLSNLVGTVAGNVTNVVSLSTTNATSKPLTNSFSAGVLTLRGLEAGANVTITANGSNWVIAAPSVSLADGDYGDITLSGGTTLWTVDNQAITWGKITNIAGYSVPGKATTGTGTLAPITAGTDSVLGRSGSGDLGFAQLASGQIANQAVTYAKIQNVTSSQRLLGRVSAGSGTPEELQIADALDWIGSVQGQILYRNAANWGTLAPGTSGQVLTTGGAGANPAWSNSAGTTNPATFAAGNIYLTNSLQVVGKSMFLRTTNMWADGGQSQLYSNVFAANAGGLTNILATNILDGQSIDLWFFPSNGVTVGFPQFVDADYVDGSAAPRTNRWNLARIWRRNTTTNIQVITKGFDLAAMTPNFFFTTNYAAGIITNQVNWNLTNLQQIAWQTETRLIPTNNALSNIVVNFGVTNYVEVWFTNNLTFTNWTGLGDDGSAASVTYLLRPQLINRGVNWGNLGLSNPGYSVAVATNANNLLWTTLTNAKTYALSMTRIRTNIFPMLTLWE
jgi:hypothetical protein